VIGTQHFNPWVSRQILKTPGLAEITDVLAVGYYIGHRLGTSMAAELETMNENEVFDYLRNVSLPEGKELLIKQKVIADQYDLGLVAYEAGQHIAASRSLEKNKELVNKIISINRNPKMYQIYLGMYKDWVDVGGGLIVWFRSTYKASERGAWGILETISQEPASAPKYQAIREMMGCS